MQQIKFRLVNRGLKPQRTKLEMPGWAGKPEPRTDGSHEYAWHCMPFTEGAQYGIEILYPHENELRVIKKNGEFVFDGEFGPPPDDDLQWPLRLALAVFIPRRGAAGFDRRAGWRPR